MVRSSRPGENVPEPVLRRLAAIVAADVAGYSRLMGIDEAGTAKALREHRAAVDPIVARFGGRVVKTTGDGVLFEFPSVVAAVECAVAVQKTMAERNADVPEDRRMLFRFGINLGDVLIQGEDILGDGVNVAARLEGIAEPGGICVSDDVYRQVLGKVDVSFEDMGEQQLKNIARPVRAYRGRPGGVATVEAHRSSPTLPDKPSIAVLPFQNMSGDPEQEYFADGIVEDIITALSRFKSLFVIARHSSFTYKGKAADVKQVGRELGVRYVLEGSVRRMGGRVRITGQLVDATTGIHFWADRFDGSLDDIFSLQDDVTARVAATLVVKVGFAEEERVRRKPTESLDAYDYLLRGRASTEERTSAGNLASIRLYQKAIELDPRFARAHAWLAMALVWRMAGGWSTDRERDRADGLRHARLAADLAGDDATVLGLAGNAIAFFARDFDLALRLVDRALSINPNASVLWARSGWVNLYCGNAEKAIEHAARAMRLTPVVSNDMHLMASGHYFSGRYDEAVIWAERAAWDWPHAFTILCILAASYAMAGRADQAGRTLARVLEIDPGFRIGDVADRFTYNLPEQVARYQEGLRKAGLPE